MKKLAALSFLFITMIVEGKSKHDYSSMIKFADALSYNFQFDSCLAVLDKAILKEPERPEAFLVKSRIYLWYFLGSRDSSDYDLFQKYSDTTITKLETLLGDQHNQTDLLYLAGSIYKYRAMAFGSIGNTLDAFWSTKNSVAYYEDVIEIDTNFYAAYGGMGIFEYALSYVPALFNWALTLSGLNADKNNGFNYIELAAEKANIDKVEYMFHLSKLLDEHLADYEGAFNILNDLLVRYPGNQLFYYQAAIELMKQREMDDAILFLEKVQNINHPKFVQTYSFSNFLLGDIHFRKKEYEKAILYYKQFLTSTKTIDYTGIASLRSAYCHYFLENNQEFRKYLLLASNGNLDIEDDIYAKNISLELLEQGLSNSREILLNMENDFLTGNDENVLLTFNSIKDSINNDIIASKIFIYASSSFIEENQIQNAQETLSLIDSLNSELSVWTVPMKYFNLAKISYFENNYILANKYLDLAEENNDYYRKKDIQSYINGLRRKLN